MVSRRRQINPVRHQHQALIHDADGQGRGLGQELPKQGDACKQISQDLNMEVLLSSGSNANITAFQPLLP